MGGGQAKAVDGHCNQENFGSHVLESQGPPLGMMREGRWSGQQGRSSGPAVRPRRERNVIL